MLAVVNTPGGPEPVAIREVTDPRPKPNEAATSEEGKLSTLLFRSRTFAL